ncbi:MAG: DUF29 domain-containing protein [Aquificaceae bacterium]|nr:DUF29 domain-containing protein [Aquificaceae bacterium]
MAEESLKELYNKDFPLWAEKNLQLLREKAYDQVDWGNLLEEIEDMARSDLKACVSHLAVVLEHLYKWDHFRNLAGGEVAGRSWIKSVNNARTDIEAILETYPSLAPKLPQELDKAWIQAKSRLKKWLENNDYEPKNFPIPNECPYTYEEAMNRDLKKEANS